MVRPRGYGAIVVKVGRYGLSTKYVKRNRGELLEKACAANDGITYPNSIARAASSVSYIIGYEKRLANSWLDMRLDNHILSNTRGRQHIQMSKDVLHEQSPE